MSWIDPKLPDNVREVLEQANASEEEAYRLHAQARELRATADRLTVSALKPERLPTPEQRDAIREAVAHILNGDQSGDHHGARIRDTGVSWQEVQQRIGVDHLAPIGRATSGGRLWDFTDEEVDDILGVIRGENVNVVSHWRHDRGVSVLIAGRG